MKKNTITIILVVIIVLSIYGCRNKGKQASDEQTDKLGIYILYDDAREDCYLYDAPMDMLLRNPEYEGKIGYICEYDSVTVVAKNTFYAANGNIDYWHEYEYDSAGNRAKETHYTIEQCQSIWNMWTVKSPIIVGMSTST